MRKATLALAAASVAAAMLWAGCQGTGVHPVAEAVVRLHLSALTTAVEGNTALVGVSLTPDAPASVTLFADALLTITEPGGTSGATVTPEVAMGGFHTEDPLVIQDYGRATLSLAARSTGGGGGGSTSRNVVIDDGYGNTLRLASLSMEFDNISRGETNLPEQTTIVTPLAGGPLTLAEARVEGLPTGEQVQFAISLSNGTRLSDQGQADATGVALFARFSTALADDVTSATVTIGAPSSGGAGGGG